MRNAWHTNTLTKRDIKFILNEWLPAEEILSFDKFKDYSKEDFDTIIDQVYKVAAEVIAPTSGGRDEVESVMKWSAYIPLFVPCSLPLHAG